MIYKDRVMDIRKIKILIYGLGWFTKRYFESTKELQKYAPIEFLGFVDKRAKEFSNGYCGLQVYLPEELPTLEYDRIFIYVRDENGLFSIIRNELIKDCMVEVSKIGNVAELLMLVQEYYRLNMAKAQTRPPKIFDCFQFYNEIEITKIRMKILDPYVDYFVVVEMDKDHRGRSKPYNFERAITSFKKYSDKIIYVQPETLPEYDDSARDMYGHVWTLEHYQRSCIKLGLVDAEPEDIILISDCDEIPDPKILFQLRADQGNEYKSVSGTFLERGAIATRQDYFYYFFNCHLKRRANTTTIVKYKNMMDPQIIREFMDYLPYIDHGGWHLTYFGGLEKIKQKISSIVEGKDVSDAEIMKRICSAQDVFGRTGNEYDMEFLEKKDIPIPNIDYWINKYPAFYFNRTQEEAK